MPSENNRSSAFRRPAKFAIEFSAVADRRSNTAFGHLRMIGGNTRRTSMNFSEWVNCGPCRSPHLKRVDDVPRACEMPSPCSVIA